MSEASLLIEAPPEGGTNRRGFVLHTLRHRPAAVIGTTILVLVALGAILAPLIAPYGLHTQVGPVFGHPSWSHPLGLDDGGIDMVTLLMWGARVSLVVGFAATLVSMLIGGAVGVIAGYFGGWIDTLLMRPIDVLLAFPALLLAIAIIAIVGPGSVVALMAIAVIYLPILSRVVRGSVLITREQAYVAGARARGASSLAIMLGHVLPNSVGPVLAQASVLTAFAIQIQAALSFLGLGAQPPTPELGLMLYEGRDVLTQAPWVEIFPGLALALATLAFTLFGNGLSARLAVRRRAT